MNFKTVKGDIPPRVPLGEFRGGFDSDIVRNIESIKNNANDDLIFIAKSIKELTDLLIDKSIITEPELPQSVKDIRRQK